MRCKHVWGGETSAKPAFCRDSFHNPICHFGVLVGWGEAVASAAVSTVLPWWRIISCSCLSPLCQARGRKVTSPRSPGSVLSKPQRWWSTGSASLPTLPSLLKRKGAVAAGACDPSFLPSPPATTCAYQEDSTFTLCEVQVLLMALVAELSSMGLTTGNTKLFCWEKEKG